MQFALNSAAEHWFWITAHLYQQQIFIGVIAVTQACCQKTSKLHRCFAQTQAGYEPVLQNSSEHWGMQFALNSAEVQWFWVTAHLYEQQILIGVFVMTQHVVRLVCRAAVNNGPAVLL